MKNSMRVRYLSRTVVSVIIAALISVFPAACTREGASKEEKGKTKVSAASQKGGEKAEARRIVQLSAEQVKIAGIEVQKVTAIVLDAPLSATAVIEPNNDRVSRVGSRVAGRITRVTAGQGDRVKAGQALAYLESVDLDQAWSEYAKARGKQTLAAASLRREEALFEKKVAPEKDVLKARQEFSEAEADLSLAAKRLQILGVEEPKEGAPAGGVKAGHALMAITSPLSGVVVEKSVTQGEMVSPEKVLFTVSDLSTLWVAMDIYEKDIGRVRTGMTVKLVATAYPEAPFKGRISYVGDTMDERSRTVKARVTVDNGKGLLKPGMFATVSIEGMKEAPAEKVLAVPESAVFLDGSEQYVFVREGDGKFTAKPVSAGLAAGSKVEIREGLKAGDEVVTKGVFTLKSELKKETLQRE